MGKVVLNEAWFAHFRGNLQFSLEEFCENVVLPKAVEEAPESHARSTSEAAVVAGKKKPLHIFTQYRRGAHTLKKSARIVNATIEGNKVKSGVVFTAPYAKAVHMGAGGARKKASADQWLTRTLDSLEPQISSGSFIKGDQ